MRRKCALIVDDSKTAREVLARKLATYDIDVETRDSAASAIDYLYGNTPDAVFMDYEMPGMDGFQALKIIKSNPNTATIPVMMYTSKAGGLELSQARALGAVGVLPKQLHHQELDAVLSELHLLPEQYSLAHGLADVDSDYHASPVPPKSHNIEYLSDYTGEGGKIEYPAEAYDESVFLLKRQTRIFQKELANAEARLKTSLSREFSAIKEGLLADRLLLNEAKAGSGGSRYFLVFLNVLILALLGLFFWQQITRHEDLVNQSTQFEKTLDGLQLEVGNLEQTLISLNQVELSASPTETDLTRPSSGESRLALLEWAANRGTEFAYGVNPYGNERVAWLSELINQFRSAGFSGVVRLKAHYGNFCLSKGETGVLNLADEQMAFSDCFFSTAVDEKGGEGGSYQTIGFANYINSLSAQRDALIEVEVEADDTEQPLVPYPEPYAVKSAGEWNSIARQNQRILVELSENRD